MGKSLYDYDWVIRKYIVMKLKEGYEPSCTREELKKFLDFVEYFLPFPNEHLTYDEIIDKYLSGPNSKKKVWSIRRKDFDLIPEVTTTDSGLIIPTYNLVSSVNSTSNVLEEYIEKFLKRNGKQRIVEQSQIADEELITFSDNAAATILLDVWNDKLKRLIEYGKWPTQCQDIQKYLIETDLALIIGLEAQQEKLLEFYYTIQERIMGVAKNDPNFRMTNVQDELLAKSNFDLIMQGYSYYRSVDKSQEYFVIDRSTNEFKDVINHYDGYIKTQKLDRPEVTELVRTLKKEK